MEIVFPLWHSKVKKIHNGITILLYILSKTHNEINILLCHSTAKKKKMKIEKKNTRGRSECEEGHKGFGKGRRSEGLGAG